MVTIEQTRPQLSPTERSTVRRGKKRAQSDRAALDAVLDAGLVCHVGAVVDGAPIVLPTGYGRDDNTLYLHGSSGAAILRAGAGAEVCVTVTLLDGVVYGRSVFHNSVNYRSAVIHGTATEITDEAEKMRALRILTEHLAPGSWDYARQPVRKELAKTAVLALDLTEAAVKIRTGGPGDEPEDITGFPGWAGEVPLHRSWGTPVPAEDLAAPVDPPAHVTGRAPLT